MVKFLAILPFYTAKYNSMVKKHVHCFEEVMNSAKKFAEKNGDYNCSVFGRIKSIGSFLRKCDLKDTCYLFDLFAFRIVINSDSNAADTLFKELTEDDSSFLKEIEGTITKKKTGRKPNGYVGRQARIRLSNIFVEIQISTRGEYDVNSLNHSDYKADKYSLQGVTATTDFSEILKSEKTFQQFCSFEVPEYITIDNNGNPIVHDALTNFLHFHKDYFFLGTEEDSAKVNADFNALYELFR